VPLDPRDLRMDIVRVACDDPCPVRVTHFPSGKTVTVGGQPTIAENRVQALALLDELVGSDGA
jgi:protein subunit release factor A